jgi:tetratricopeptide (TPR) repeat protein
MAGFCTQGTGRYELSIEASKKAIALDPDHPIPYASLVSSYLFLHRLQEAEDTIRRMSERKLDAPEFLVLLRYFIAFLRGDTQGMRRETARARGRQGVEDMLTHAEALVLARSGRLRDARRMSSLAVNLARQAGKRERAAMFEAGAGVRDALFGYVDAARQSARRAIELSTGRDVQYAAAFALALSGESSQSRLLADDLARRFPEDTSVQFSYLPVLRTLFALNGRTADAAVQLLEPAARFDFATHGLAFNGFFGALHSVYVRGLAYLAADQPDEAASEFQKILDHRGVVIGDPLDAMARLQLGRALAASGDPAKARTAYQDLLQLWKDADPDLLILAQARAESDRLR